MENVIVGNVCSLCAMTTDIVSSSRKTGKGVIIMQTFSQVFYAVGTLFLGGYSAVVQNGISILRNITAISKIKSRILEWIFIIAGVVIGIYFNNLGLIGFIPIVSNFGYSLCVFKFKHKERLLKIAFAITMFMYVFFNFAILNYVGAVSNLITFIVTMVFVIKNRKK